MECFQRRSLPEAQLVQWTASTEEGMLPQRWIMRGRDAASPSERECPTQIQSTQQFLCLQFHVVQPLIVKREVPRPLMARPVRFLFSILARNLDRSAPMDRRRPHIADST